MSRKISAPPEEHVRALMAQMLADTAASGPRPTVLAVTRRAGLANATFSRHYPDIANELRRHAASGIQAAPSGT